MSLPSAASKILRGVALLFLGGIATLAVAVQKEDPATPQLPAELRGAKVYKFADETKAGAPPENPVIYKNVSYQDINFNRLVLNLYLSIKPVERAATIRKIYFQDIRVGGVPVQVETFEEEFKLSKKEVVDLPAPLKCSIVFSDLGSLGPLKQIVDQEKIQITGQSFIEVKLNPLEKLALRTKQLVLPVTLNEDVPLQMFSGNPLLQMGVKRVLDTLSDPSAAAAIALSKEHVAKRVEDRTLATAGRESVFLLYCEYVLRNPKTRAAEKFSQSGTGFVVSKDGKLLTAKRVIQPWKFDPQIAFLMNRYHLEFDSKGYRLSAWPVGAQVLSADGQPDLEKAYSTEKQTLQVLKTAPDRIEKREYQDPDSGGSATLSLHVSGENDAAVLQLIGQNFQALAFADSDLKVGPDLRTALFGFPFGMSQGQAAPRPIRVQAAREGSLITLDRQLNPGESGAPLLTPEGKVLAFSGGTNECIAIEAVRPLFQ